MNDIFSFQNIQDYIREEPGIYMIINQINAKSYIGQTKHLKQRLYEHRKAYNSISVDYNKALYKAMREFGIENFRIRILEKCQILELNERERFWIEYYDTYHNGYNMTRGGDSYPDPKFGEEHHRHKLTEQDVINIRTMYNNHCQKRQVFELYKDKISFSGFCNVWQGKDWPHVMMEVYTLENRKFHRTHYGTLKYPKIKKGPNDRKKLTRKEVREIRIRKNNGELMDDVYEDYKHIVSHRAFKSAWNYESWKEVVI